MTHTVVEYPPTRNRGRSILIRFIGFIAIILLALSLLDYYNIIQVTATPLKQLIDAIIALAGVIKGKIKSF